MVSQNNYICVICQCDIYRFVFIYFFLFVILQEGGVRIGNEVVNVDLYHKDKDATGTIIAQISEQRLNLSRS